jgi:hypothetical protein
MNDRVMFRVMPVLSTWLWSGISETPCLGRAWSGHEIEIFCFLQPSGLASSNERIASLTARTRAPGLLVFRFHDVTARGRKRNASSVVPMRIHNCFRHFSIFQNIFRILLALPSC